MLKAFSCILFLSTLLTLPDDVFAEPWEAVSPSMLTINGVNDFADRLEVIANDDCSGFELRAWARSYEDTTDIIDTLDIVIADLEIANMPALHNAMVISVVRQFSENFDVVYISFGAWDWGMIQALKGKEAQDITVVFNDSRIDLETNGWKIDTLPKELEELKHNCFPHQNHFESV